MADTQQRVSLNADIGEGFGAYSIGDDEALMDVLTDVNIACGFHAGDPSVMRRRVVTAAEKNLGIGAHVGYPDLRGFGRRHLQVSASDIYDDTVYQIGALQGMCSTVGVRVKYIKPHGALYHDAWTDEETADAVARAAHDVDSALAFVCPPDSAMAIRAAAHSLRVVAEGYMDRGYLADGHLAPRSHPDALVHDPQLAAARALGMLQEGQVLAVTGETVAVRPQTVCVHSDSPGAAALARAVRTRLEGEGFDVASFTRD